MQVEGLIRGETDRQRSDGSVYFPWSFSHRGTAEHLKPFAKTEVGGIDHSGLLIQLGDQMEAQLAASNENRETE